MKTHGKIKAPIKIAQKFDGAKATDEEVKYTKKLAGEAAERAKAAEGERDEAIRDMEEAIRERDQAREAKDEAIKDRDTARKGEQDAEARMRADKEALEGIQQTLLHLAGKRGRGDRLAHDSEGSGAGREAKRPRNDQCFD